MKRKCIIGIDPGYNGAIAVLYFDPHDDPRECELFIESMPVKRVENRPPEIDLAHLFKILAPHVEFCRYVALEKVFLMPFQDIGSGARYIYGAGQVHGLCVGLGLNVLPIIPGVWKSALKLNADKRGSLILARELFPSYAHEFRRMKDDGRAEAVLIAHFARRLVK